MAWSYWCGYCEKDWPHIPNKYSTCPICDRACDTEKQSEPMTEAQADALLRQAQRRKEKERAFDKYLAEQEELQVAAFRGELDAWLTYQ